MAGDESLGMDLTESRQVHQSILSVIHLGWHLLQRKIFGGKRNRWCETSISGIGAFSIGAVWSSGQTNNTQNHACGGFFSAVINNKGIPDNTPNPEQSQENRKHSIEKSLFHDYLAYKEIPRPLSTRSRYHFPSSPRRTSAKTSKTVSLECSSPASLVKVVTRIFHSKERASPGHQRIGLVVWPAKSQQH